MAEANIVVEGTVLTQAQALVLRIALDAFRERMSTEGLGEDDVGRSLARAYVERAAEVLDLIHKAI